MTITFENDNDVIVYTLERVISYARQYQYIFVAQSVWWLASISGLEQGLLIHIDNLKRRSDIKIWEVTPQAKDTSNQIHTSHCRKEVSTMPWDIQDDLRLYNDSGHIHPDRTSHVQPTINDLSDLQLSSSLLDQCSQIVKETERFIQKSQKARKTFKKHRDPLLRTRSGKVISKPLSKKQRNYLHSISKDTIASYLDNRK